jgi:hypothetical protein
MRSAPDATFDIRPPVKMTSDVSEKMFVSVSIRNSRENNTLCCLPDKISLSQLFEGSDFDWKRCNYIIKAISMSKWNNPTNIPLKIVLHVYHHHHDDGESKEPDPIVIDVPASPTKGPLGESTYFYVHPYTKDVMFYSLPTWRNEILNYTPIDLKRNDKLMMVKTDSAFYYVYKDSLSGFTERMRQDEEIHKNSTTATTTTGTSQSSIFRPIDTRIHLLPNENVNDCVYIHQDAISKFKTHIKETKYSHLLFADFERSYISIQLAQTKIEQRDLDVFQKKIHGYYQDSNLLRQLHDQLPVICVLKFECLQVQKNRDSRIDSQLVRMFPTVHPGDLNMNIYSKTPITQTNSNAKVLHQSPKSQQQIDQVQSQTSAIILSDSTEKKTSI